MTTGSGVAGDRGTGKSTLIITAATNSSPTNVPPVLPPTKLPAYMFPVRVQVWRIEVKFFDELRTADVVVLTYACDRLSTLDQIKVPVIVAGCKLDLNDEQPAVTLEQVMEHIMQQFWEVKTCIQCSAYQHIQIPDVFHHAQKTVLYPADPLFDPEAQNMKTRCVRALKRIFIICDHDRDGALSDAELNAFQVKCFDAPMAHSEILGVKSVVQEQFPDGVNKKGLTLPGFLYLQALFIQQDRLEVTWTILRKFGYNNDIRLGDDQLSPLIKRTPDQSVELTNEAVEFLRGVFSLFDIDGDGALSARDLDNLFSTAPESPWNEAPYANAADKNALGGLSLDGFLSEWALMTLLDPVFCFENLMYIGYAGTPSSAVKVTKRRSIDYKKQHSDRNVFQCFVFGPKEAGKSSLLHSSVRRPFSAVYTPTTMEQYTVNIVDQADGMRKTLILREIPEDEVEKLLAHKEALASCDIAVFVHDSSNKSSWIRATELLVQVASRESSGYAVPCLIVAAKDDLEAYSTAIQDLTKVSKDMGIDAPIPISTKSGDLNNVFSRIVRAAEHPHLSIPETEAGKSRKQYHKLLNRSLRLVSVGAACVFVGFAAYRVYASRKNT